MLHGYPVSGKSTAAHQIRYVLESRHYKADIIKSVAMRYGDIKDTKLREDFVDENVESTRKEKDTAYHLLCKIAEETVNKNIIPILDATFHKYYRRKWVYNIAEKLGADVIVVWLEHEDEVRIKKILKKRRKNRDLRDRILCTWGQYKTMVGQTDSITDYEIKNKEKIKILKSNRTNNTLNIYNCAKDEPFISLICEALQD